jgi:hypothetical protein
VRGAWCACVLCVCVRVRACSELLGAADVLVGNMGSHVTRMIYNKMVSASRTSVLPPFISVDGYGTLPTPPSTLAPSHPLTLSPSHPLPLSPTLSPSPAGLCCDFTEECSKDDIRKRRRSIRDCIHKYGQCTGATRETSNAPSRDVAAADGCVWTDARAQAATSFSAGRVSDVSR